jgi:acetyltransferase-like isoleucine patch superfamily enzyme
MGAGSITSNVRSDKKNIVVHAGAGIETGMRKIGAMLGDHAEIGCNSVLNPGTVVGRNAIVYPTSCVRGIVPENHIYKGEGNVVARKQEF